MPGNSRISESLMPPSFLFREALAADRAAMARIYHHCLASAAWMPPEVAAVADFDRDTEGERLFVMESAGRVIGFISIWEPESFIHHLYVDPEAQGRGVGPGLLTGLQRHVSPPWRLKCSCDNHRAHQFYLRQGWLERETGDSDTGPYWLMEKLFPG